MNVPSQSWRCFALYGRLYLASTAVFAVTWFGADVFRLSSGAHLLFWAVLSGLVLGEVAYGATRDPRDRAIGRIWGFVGVFLGTIVSIFAFMVVIIFAAVAVLKAPQAVDEVIYVGMFLVYFAPALVSAIKVHHKLL
jgi:hypothetical protein